MLLACKVIEACMDSVEQQPGYVAHAVADPVAKREDSFAAQVGRTLHQIADHVPLVPGQLARGKEHLRWKCRGQKP
jgi:hypothetical protein